MRISDWSSDVCSSDLPKPGDRLVEIGPGQGAMTFPLLERHGALTAIEFDRDLLQPLAAAARAHGELTLVHANVLDVDFSALAAGTPIRLVGNLPYNLSSPILFHALDHAAAVRDMHFMLQKEVVERAAAGPGSKVYGQIGRASGRDRVGTYASCSVVQGSLQKKEQKH